MYRPTLSSAPASTPISATEAKSHLRVDFTDDDTYIGILIDAAVSYLDGYYGILGRAMVTQTWVQKYNGWDSALYLPVFPVASVTSVTYLDIAGNTQTVSSSLYTLLTDDQDAYVQFLNAFTYPTTTTEFVPSVTVTYVSGVASGSVPIAIKMAIYLLIGHWYENRETVNIGGIPTELEYTVKHLVAPFRRLTF